MSVSVSVSQLLRTSLESRFSALFNPALVDAFAAFVTTDQAFAINFDEVEDLPPNFYREDRTIDSLVQHNEPELPGMAMWIGDGQNLTLEKSRLFSGHVAVYWRFFGFVAGIRKAGLVDQREAFEAALIATLDPEFVGFGYRGDLSWGNPAEKQILAQDDAHFGWSQEILYTATFEVNV